MLHMAPACKVFMLAYYSQCILKGNGSGEITHRFGYSHNRAARVCPSKRWNSIIMHNIAHMPRQKKKTSPSQASPRKAAAAAAANAAFSINTVPGTRQPSEWSAQVDIGGDADAIIAPLLPRRRFRRKKTALYCPLFPYGARQTSQMECGREGTEGNGGRRECHNAPVTISIAPQRQPIPTEASFATMATCRPLLFVRYLAHASRYTVFIPGMLHTARSSPSRGACGSTLLQ